MSGESSARTLGHALSEIQFAIVYGGLNERFWSHVDTGINVFQAICGALAIAGALTSPWLTAAAGTLLAINAAFQLAVSPRKRSIEFRDARRAFQALKAEALRLEHIDVEQRLERLKAEAPVGLSVMDKPAYNIVVESLEVGQPYELTTAERVALKFAF